MSIALLEPDSTKSGYHILQEREEVFCPADMPPFQAARMRDRNMLDAFLSPDPSTLTSLKRELALSPKSASRSKAAAVRLTFLFRRVASA